LARGCVQLRPSAAGSLVGRSLTPARPRKCVIRPFWSA